MNLIPKKIYQSWKSKSLPPEMEKISKRTREMNPEYEYELWDDNDCREFLLKNFGENYANAFDTLIPGAFKCDFWRYAILYVNGGVYLDMDMTPEVPFREILKDTDEFVSIVDINTFWRRSPAIYQAFLACRPGHPILSSALQMSFLNIASKRYDMFQTLSITGPVVVGVALNLYWKRKNSTEKISPGEYGEGIRLFKMNPEKTTDLSGKVLFNNKFSGYKRGVGDYNSVKSFYRDDPNREITTYCRWAFSISVCLLILSLFSNFFLWRRCRK